MTNDYAPKISKNRMYFMPHRAVHRTVKVTRTRIAFDTSSHENWKTSLNDHLWEGKIFNSDILTFVRNVRIESISLVEKKEVGKKMYIKRY